MGQSESGINDPEAAAVVERLVHLASSDDFEQLDNPQAGYAVIPDSEQQSLFVVLSQTNYQTRKTEYGLDMGTVTGEVLAQTPGEFTHGDWITAEIPHKVQPIAKGANIDDNRAVFILGIKQIGNTGVDNLEASLHDTYEQRTVVAGMYPDIADGALMSDADLEVLKIFGYHAEVYRANGQPAVSIIFPIRRVLIDYLQSKQNPRFVLEQFLSHQHPNQSIAPDQTGFISGYPTFPYRYDRNTHFSTHYISLDTTGFESPMPVFRYVLPIAPETQRPVQAAHTLRNFITEQMAIAGMPDFETEPQPEQEITATWLSGQSFASLVSLYEQTMHLPMSERNAAVQSKATSFT